MWECVIGKMSGNGYRGKNAVNPWRLSRPALDRSCAPRLTWTSRVVKDVLNSIWQSFQLSLKIHSRIERHKNSPPNKNFLIFFFCCCCWFKSNLVCISSAQLHCRKTIGCVARRVFPQLALEWLGTALWIQFWIKYSNPGLIITPHLLHFWNIVIGFLFV